MRALIKRLIPRSLLEQILNGRESADRKLALFCSKNRFLSAVYYLLFSNQFSREQYAVLNGRAEYWRSLQSDGKNNVMLRRNIHRLEKGIIMRPRRDVFAEGYITETVERFLFCSKNGQLSAGEQKWATEVITNYFSIVSDTAVIKSAREMFFGYVGNSDGAELQSVPYQRKALAKSDVSYEQFRQLCVQRRSVRWFKDKPVEKELIEQAVSVATLAPSACNRQPFFFHIANQPELARTLGRIPMGTAGFSHNFQGVVVVVGDLSAYPYERDQHVIYIDASLAAMQLMLALETLGLSSCVINWPDIEAYEKRMDEALQLEPHLRPVMVISVGYADDEGMIPFSQKKSTKELIKEIER